MNIIIVKIIAIIVLLMFSAFFSASETAIFSLDALKLRKMRRRGGNAKKVSSLLQNPIRLLTTILIGNMLVNITASSIAGAVAIQLLGQKGVGISIAVMTFLLLIFGEVTPKRYAIERALAVSAISAPLLSCISIILSPIHYVLYHSVNKLLPNTIKEPTLSEEELKMVIDIGHKEGIIAGHEKELIGAVLGFSDTLIKSIMVQREKIKAISADVPQEECIGIAKTCKHSKIPVYKNSLDNVMGILSIKDLFLNPGVKFTEIIKPVLFISEDKKIKEVLRTFEAQNLKIAVVIDNNGKTRGLITIEDILEEVFGEIYDEFEALTVEV